MSVQLDPKQSRAVVLVEGDNASGTGFFVKTPDGPAILTNIHVIFDNPNLKASTVSGKTVKILSAKGASDRDLALLMIEDDNYDFLPMSTSLQTLQPGEDVITPGNSKGGGVVLNTGGKLLGLGPDRVEFDNPIYHGNSGGPIILKRTGEVLGVVTEAVKEDVSNAIDKSSFASRNSAIKNSTRYFGLRYDTVPSWVPIVWNRFAYEAHFLNEFNHRSRALDSLLNRKKGDNSGSTSSEDDKLYLTDPKIAETRAKFEHALETEGQHRLDVIKDYLFDLNDIADIDMDYIQELRNFHVFDQERAKDEIEYRKALKHELEQIGKAIETYNPN